LVAGADIDCADQVRAELCCLSSAVVGYRNGTVAILNLFLQHGFTPLHYASAFGHLAAAQMFVKYGAKVDIQDKQGKTPESLATEGRQVHVAEYLATVAQGRTSCARLRDWLHAIGLAAYYNGFLAQGFDDIDFLSSAGLTEGDLDAVGVVLAGHRSKLLQVYRIHEFAQPPAGGQDAASEASGDGSGSGSSGSGSGSDSDEDSDESD